MAGKDNKILIGIALEGDAEVNKKLDAVSQHGEQMSKNLSATSPTSLGSGAGELERGSGGADKLRESIHVLHPILESAGLGLGNLGAFARLAGAGLGALAAAVVGSIVVGLAKLRDEADQTERKLDLLAGGGKGSGVFSAWKTDADNLGTSLGKVLPLVEQLTELKATQEAAQQSGGQVFSSAFKQTELPPGAVRLPEGGPVTNEQNRAAAKATIEAGRLDRTSPDVATKQMADLLKGANSGKGLLTEDLLSPEKLSTSLGQAITDALRSSGAIPGNIQNTAQLRQGLGSGQFEVPGEKIVPALARAEPSIREQSEKVPIDFTEAVERSKAQLEEFGAHVTDAGVKVLEFVGNLEHAALDKRSGATLINNPAPAGPNGEQLPPFQSPFSREEWEKTVIPSPFTNGRRSEAAPATPAPAGSDQAATAAIGTLTATVSSGDQTTQSALSSGFQAVVAAIAAALQKPIEQPSGPVSGVGIRGEGDAQDVTVATGGHIRGPGTGTSDSIPAMLSDGEYVVKADAVKRLGVDELNAINNGSAHFADGGAVKRFADGGKASNDGWVFRNNRWIRQGSDGVWRDRSGSQVNSGGFQLRIGADGRTETKSNGTARTIDAPDDLTSMAAHSVDVAGVKYYGKDSEDTNRMFDELNKSQQEAEQQEKYQRSHRKKSLFVGSYDSHDMANYQFKQDRDESYTGGFGLARGGLVGSAPRHSRLRSIINGFANGGMIDVPHLAVGGMPGMPTPDLSNSSVFNSAPKGDSAGVPHHTVDLRTDHGTFRMMSPEETARQLGRAAHSAKRFSTGAKPNWYGG